jgi:heat shock protein HslJ
MRLLLLLAAGCAGALLTAACATNGIPRLGTGEFVALDVNGAPVAAGRPLTLRLGEGGQASGNSGCNSFTTTYQLASRERIDFGPIASTRMACAPEIMEQEARFLSILGAAGSYSVYGSGAVSIIAPDGRAIRFRR